MIRVQEIQGGRKQHKFRSVVPITDPMSIQIPRTSFGRRISAKRPIDKLLVNVVKSNVDATQEITVLTTATFPCTIVGLRWDLTFASSAGSALATYAWVIIILRDGSTVSTIAISDAGSLYQPEQDVLAFGRGFNGASALGIPSKYMGSTKTMRKLMGGDRLQFVMVGEATNTTACAGCIQFFCKT